MRLFSYQSESYRWEKKINIDGLIILRRRDIILLKSNETRQGATHDICT